MKKSITANVGYTNTMSIIIPVCVLQLEYEISLKF